MHEDSDLRKLYGEKDISSSHRSANLNGVRRRSQLYARWISPSGALQGRHGGFLRIARPLAIETKLLYRYD